MNVLILLVALISAMFAGCAANANSSVSEQFEKSESESFTEREPVLVELFTSEGCSSCPPADRTLAFLASSQPVPGVDVITLGYHVDYWDYLGWKDPFSSPEFSRRQEFYVRAFGLDSSYTPQMVVDGYTEFVGSNMERAVAAIGDSVMNKKGTVAFSISGNELCVEVKSVGQHSDARVMLAVAEDGLETDVKRGENGGKKLSHVSVVRSLHTLGSLESTKNSANFTYKIEDKDKARSKSHFVAFLQDEKTKRILAVGKSGTK